MNVPPERQLMSACESARGRLTLRSCAMGTHNWRGLLSKLPGEATDESHLLSNLLLAVGAPR
jgi:hypothetical protein